MESVHTPSQLNKFTHTCSNILCMWCQIYGFTTLCFTDGLIQVFMAGKGHCWLGLKEMRPGYVTLYLSMFDSIDILHEYKSICKEFPYNISNIINILKFISKP